MFKNSNRKISDFAKKILIKIRPRFSLHYISYTVLTFMVVFSIVHLATATTPNPGHPWTEVGDGNISFTDPLTPVTYTGPTVNATLLTTANLVTIAQGGTNASSFSNNGVVYYNNGSSKLDSVVNASGSTLCLTQVSSGTPTWGSCTTGAITSLSAIGSSPNANGATITGSVLNLEPASASFGGVVTTGTQTFAGDKTVTGLFTGSFNSLGTTQDPAKGFALTNTTAASAGAQQISPAFVWSGQGWKTNATAASQNVSFRSYVLPTQGAANPTGSWLLQSSINGGAYVTRVSVGTSDSADTIKIGDVAGGSNLINITSTGVAVNGSSGISLNSPGIIFTSNGSDEMFDFNSSTGVYQLGDLSAVANGSKITLDDTGGVAYYDKASHTGFFGINTNTPAVALDVVGSSSITSGQSSTAFTVARLGSAYAFQVDTNTASSATGLKITAAAAGGGLALSTISTGTNENLTLDAKGSGTLSLGATSTGDVLLAGGSGATGCTVANSTGNLTCTGNITGSSTGTLGYWSRSGTTLSPATANDIVSIANSTTTGADFGITNTGVYTGTGIFNLTANSTTTGTLASITGNGLTSGSLLSLSSNGTAGINNQKGLNISLSGINGTTGQTTYGAYISNTHDGVGDNIGLYVTTTLGQNNYAAIFDSGLVGIGTTAPEAALHINNTSGDELILQNQSSTGASAIIFRHKKIGLDHEWSLGPGTGSSNTAFSLNNTTDSLPDLLSVTTSGNVGIGTTSPNVALSLYRSGTDLPALRLEDGDITVPSFSSVGFNPVLTTNTVGGWSSRGGAFGGMAFNGFTNSTDSRALYFSGYSGKTTVDMPVVEFTAWKHDGSTNRTALTTTEPAFDFANGSTSLMRMLANGNVGIGITAPTSKLQINKDQNSVSQNDANGILLANATAATVGVQSISPGIVLQGNGWKTNATAGSQDVRFRQDVLPVQGAANPSATWQLASSINSGAYANRLTVASSGDVTIPGASNILQAPWIVAVSGFSTSVQYNVANSTSGAKLYRTTNGGSDVTPGFFGGSSGVVTAGTLGYATDVTNGFSFTAANGTRHIARAGLQITNLSNGAGSESGDLTFYTQAAGAAMAQRFNLTGSATTATATIGVAGSTLGGLNLTGNTSGTISILPQAAAGTYNFNLPTTAGSSGYLLTSGGGGGTAMTWTDPATFAPSTGGSGYIQNQFASAQSASLWVSGKGAFDTSLSAGGFASPGNYPLEVKGSVLFSDVNGTSVHTVTTGPGATTTARIAVFNSITGGANVVLGGDQGGGGVATNPNIFFADHSRSYASIQGILVGGGGTNQQYGDLVFSTSPDISATALTERLRISSVGLVSIAGNESITSSNTTQTTTSSALALNVNSLTTGTGLYVGSSSLTSGSLIDVAITGTAGLTSQKGLNISLSGANGTGAQTTYGAYLSNTHTGTSNNVGLYATASGGSNNYAAVFDSGNVGIGTTAPSQKLEVVSDDVLMASFHNTSNAGVYLGYDGTDQFGLYDYGSDHVLISHDISSDVFYVGSNSGTPIMQLDGATSNVSISSLTSAGTQCVQASSTGVLSVTGSACGSGSGGVTTVGTFSGSSQTNGANITGSTITFGPADTTNPGMVTASGSQTFGGQKLFSNSSTTGADLGITNTGVYTGTGIFNITANSATTGTLASITGNGLTTGSLLSLSSSSTAATTGQKGLNVALTGALTGAQTTYGGYLSNTRTGASAVNVGLYATASGATGANYAAIFDQGSVGIGTTAPDAGSKVSINGRLSVFKGTEFSYSSGTYTDFVVSNSSDNSRFLFGQDTSNYGGMVWNYNATTANAYLIIGTASTGTPKGIIIDNTSNSYVNIGGDNTPNDLFTVGATSQFQVNSSGAIAAAAGITSSGTITFSGLGGGGTKCVQTDNSGVITAASGACGSGTVTNTGGSLTSNSIVLGAGTNDTKVVAGITTDGTSIINLGVNATTAGKLKLFGGTSGDVTLQPTAAAGTATTQTLPATSGTLVNRVTTANGVSASNTDGALSFTLGAITPTTVNGNTFTTGSYTLTGTAGKTLTFNNSITLAGTDSTTMTFPTTSKTIAANDGSNLTFASQAVGDIIYANSTTSFTRLADVALGSCLISGGVGAAPSWGSCGGGSSLWSGIGAPTADLTLAHGAYKTNFSFNSVTTGNAFSLNSSGLSSGSILDLTVTGTAGLTGQKGLNISLSGANGTGAQTTYGAYLSNTHTGTSNNVGLYATASGGSNNYAGIFDAGRVLFGTTSNTSSISKLYISGSLTNEDGSTGAGVAGIHEDFTFNPTSGTPVQVGNRLVVTNTGTVSTTQVGQIIRMIDSPSSGTPASTIRGLEVVASAGTNTASANTGIRATGHTFGVQGITTGLGGSVFAPAALYGETQGTTQGDALRLYTTSLTTAPALATFYQDLSSGAFTGSGLLMDMGTSNIARFTGSFMTFKNGGTQLAHLDDTGEMYVTLASTGSSAVCHTTNGAQTDERITDCSGSVNADYAEMYPVESGVEYGDVMSVGTEMVNTYDDTNGAVDWTKLKGKITRLVKSSKAYDKGVIGIVSKNNGDFSSTGYNIKPEDNPMPVALNGRVPVKVATDSDAIMPGDYLTTSSSEAGKVMKARKAGEVIGKALEIWTPDSNQATVMVYVEQGFYNGEAVSQFAGIDPVASDFAKQVLKSFMNNQGNTESNSELTLDRISAGLEIITPRLIADNVATNIITGGTGNDVGLVLSSDGKFVIGGQSTTNNDGTSSVSNPAITFDSLGNATFNGKITAKEIEVNSLAGIQDITDQINQLSQGQVAFNLTASVMNTLSGALTVAQSDILKLESDIALANTKIDGLTTSGTDIDNRLTTIESLLAANAFNGLTSLNTSNLSVDGDTNLNGQVAFNGLTVFSMSSTFNGDITLNGQTEFTLPPLFNKDTAGFAIVKTGDRRVRIDFGSPYISTPVVNTSIAFETSDDINDSEASNLFSKDVRFIITSKDQNGFTILLNKNAPRDIRFSWNALAVRDPNIFQSVFEGLVIDPTPESTPTPDQTPTPPADQNPPADPTPDQTPTPPADQNPPADAGQGDSGNGGGDQTPPTDNPTPTA